MIEIKELTKVFDKAVLDKMSYTFEKNKIYVIKGISGCGKTTLLNILGGLETQFEGEYYFEGKAVKQLRGAERKDFRESIGYIFQSSLLMSNLTIMENLLYINNDKDLIEQYARQLNVEKLLEKQPEQLSGGERQRISVIRTLIQHPKVILADEPTASLDKLNSRDIANIFSTLRGEERTIIIATHENCFDDVADEIIHLGYGVIKSIETKEHKQSSEIVSATELEQGGSKSVMYNAQRKGNSLKVLVPLIFRRHREKFRVTALLPTIFIITALLICFAVQHNFKSELMKIVVGQYPTEVFTVTDIEADTIEEKYEVAEKYYSYRIITDEYVCARLLPKEDSVLAYGGLLQYGKFPMKENEVLISYDTALGMSGEEHIEDSIGQSLNIQDREYIVSGVVANIGDGSDGVFTDDYYLYASDIIYLNMDSINVYIPYENISKFGELGGLISDDVTIKIEGLYEDKEMYNDIKYNILPSYISQVDGKISNVESSVENVTKIIYVSFVVVAIMAAIFIKNDIEVDLFYRRKELGYLQVFGVKKKSIWLQLILEKMAKNTICTFLAVILYYIIAVLVKVFVDINGFIPVSYVLLVIAVELGFTLISVLLPIWKYMRKSVLKLITE